MSDSALEAPRLAGAAAPGIVLARAFRTALGRTWASWVVALALLAVSAGVVAWAKTAPSYDAFGWLVWGFQTLHGKLDLGGAPSWKPLPFVFTVPYALAPMAVEKFLWMLTAVFVSLGGAIIAGRIAHRLTLAGANAPAAAPATPARRYAALAAGVFAGVALLGTEDYTHYILSVQSDPMIVAFTLAAVDAHLCRRPRLAIVCGVLASLGRPEAWPFLALYALWCWLRVPRTRWLVVAGAAAIAFMWFGVPWITNGRPFVSAQLAFHSPRELTHNQVVGTLERFHELHYWPLWVAAAVAVAWGAWRRNRLVLALTAIAAGWVVIEIAFALHGWPALPRYMFEAGGLVAVLGGVAVGWVLAELPRVRAGVPRWTGIPVVAVLVVALIPGALGRVRTEHRDLTHERGRAQEIVMLATATQALGGWRHIERCAKPTADVEWVSALAWVMHSDVGLLGHKPELEIHHSHPVVWFVPLTRGGWHIVPYHLHRHGYAACHRLRSYFEKAHGYPGGRLLRY